ncbi:hypothetical protein DCS32_06495 [Dokdonia sp. Dokd-P16]|uniref:hypothetical protein n=1 Tax=Dokdonia sp. Dokd-P16 TaxID=2173169 RepID=UPI000D546F6B|nr:hypothetical protein [Dokdonia sp. Dokd-P16]AWH73813.1 hypothetical protein DCS32_06495 [Dokdonia sp. Dokd-P16]
MKINTIILSAICFTIFLSCDSSTENKSEHSTQENLAITTPKVLATPTHFYVNSSSGLSLRSGTNLTSKKILTLPYGAQVSLLSNPEHTEMTVDGITGEMIEVNYQGATGFAFNGYLTSLAPPQPNEDLEAYTNRISTPERPIKVLKKANKKGEDYGMTTTLELPAKNWNEAYRISQRLFNLPKGINPELSNRKETVTIINGDKRDRTQTDQLTINITPKGDIANITYSYSLRDYKRTVMIKKSNNAFVITEEEMSL